MTLEEAIERFRGPLVGLVASWGVPFHDATIIAQDSLADAHLSRHNCRGDLSDPCVYGRWLKGVARNHFRNWLRTHKRTKSYVAYVDPSLLDEHPTSVDPAEEVRVRLVREAIQRLPDKQRRVILMHYLEETSVKEVAALLSVTPKTVEGRLYQARRSLARMLSQTLEAADRGRPKS